MRILHLTLKRKWFDMIASGEKKEEYREMKEYWVKRLGAVFPKDYHGKMEFKEYEEVHFRNGYSSTAPYMKVKCNGIRIGYGKSEWGTGDKTFIIELGDILEINQ